MIMAIGCFKQFNALEYFLPSVLFIYFLLDGKVCIVSQSHSGINGSNFTWGWILVIGILSNYPPV